MKEILWCIWTWETLQDFILTDWDIDTLPNLYEQDRKRFQYNQANQRWSTVSCTIFSAVGAVADLMNYDFSLDEIKEIDELSYSKWRIRWEGRYTQSAVHLVYLRRNNNEELVKKYWKISYYRVNKYSERIDEILQRWYTMVTNMKPTAEYQADYRKDAMLDWNQFWTSTNWHAIDIIRDDEKERSVKDSYKWRKTSNWKKDCNIYWLVHQIRQLTNYWNRLYLYTKTAEDNFERIKLLNELKTRILIWIPNNSELRELTWNNANKDKLHEMNDFYRNRLAYINDELKILS